MLMKNNPSLFWGEQIAESAARLALAAALDLVAVGRLTFPRIWARDALLSTVIWDWTLQTKTTMEIMAFWKGKFSVFLLLLL